MSFLNTDFFNEFKIKNLKYHNTHDGIDYICDIYIGRKKIAVAENSGRGGETIIDFFDKGLPKAAHVNSETKRLFNRLCDRHNAKQTLSDFYNENTMFPSTKEWKPVDFDEEAVISTLIEDFIQLNETKKDVQKHQTKAICFGIPGTGNYQRLVWRKSISVICKTTHGKTQVQKEIDKVKKEIKGTKQVILNTNLTRNGLIT